MKQFVYVVGWIWLLKLTEAEATDYGVWERLQISVVVVP